VWWYFTESRRATLSAFRIREDGTQKKELTSSQINQVPGASPDGKFVIAWNRIGTKAFPSSGGEPISILDAICFLRWQGDRKSLYLSVATGMQTALTFGRTYVIPTSPEKLFPPMPPGGFRSEDEIAQLPGVRVTEAADVYPGSPPGTYA